MNHAEPVFTDESDATVDTGIRLTMSNCSKQQKWKMMRGRKANCVNEKDLIFVPKW